MAGHKKSDAFAAPLLVSVHVMVLPHMPVQAGQPTRPSVEQRNEQAAGYDQTRGFATRGRSRREARYFDEEFPRRNNVLIKGARDV